jgi:serine protease
MTGGWYTDNTANTQGEVGAELADLCAWGAGGSGSADAVNLNLLTGTFAVQALWSNADDGCVSSDSIVTMAKLGTHRLVGPSVDLVPSASTTATNPNLRWGATGLPLGVSINRTTGEISGSTAPGSWAIKVTATDANEVTASRQLTLVVAGTASLVRS